jgi:hypothetical protein
VASHAADIIAALPTTQLLRRQYLLGSPSSAHAKLLVVPQEAFKLIGYLLEYERVELPLWLHEKLLGGWGPV